MAVAVSTVWYWLPAALWMLVIFGGSGEALAAHRTSRILGPIIRWLFPSLAQDKVDLLILLIRKCAHAVEFGVLAVLFWLALVKPSRHNKPEWRWSDARRALVLTALYAALDEFRQSFVPSRQGAVQDVCIDVAGAVIALLLLSLLGRWRGWWRNTSPDRAAAGSE
ncbi:MAG: VanZ family protein [Verrucomicrobiae bacterium]|nr:VanZ family protein [Verrucomicrobiae bacterium]MDW7981155.1 VanZ family protein [Verrucomicrobiales bacterium]